MLDVITDNLDIWTTAQKQKKAVGRGRAKKDEAYGVKKLRELILELAVRGKLVPQDASDEPANVLLERIAEEKQQLIKEGKIKKQKALPEIADNSLDTLPSSWKMIKLDKLLVRISNGFSGKQNKDGIGYPLTRIETISLSKIDLTKLGYSPDIPKDKVSYFKLCGGDILLSHINSDYHVGKTALIPNDVDLYHGINLILLRFTKNIVVNYVDLVINTLRFSGYFISIAQHAIGQSSINQGKIKNIPVPIPPLAEQHRIVAKVDELMALCDQLEQEQTDHQTTHQTLVETLLNGLVESAKSQAKNEVNNQQSTADYFNQLITEHFDTLFTTEKSIDQLKQTILQLAVMGKLVPQDPNDEPANVLLEKIAEEKTRLIKAGNIKKQKTLPEIGEDEKLFELPTSWKLIRFVDFVEEVSTGPFGTMIHKQDYVDEGVPLINPSHMINSKIVVTTQPDKRL